MFLGWCFNVVLVFLLVLVLGLVFEFELFFVGLIFMGLLFIVDFGCECFVVWWGLGLGLGLVGLVSVVYWFGFKVGLVCCVVLFEFVVLECFGWWLVWWSFVCLFGLWFGVFDFVVGFWFGFVCLVVGVFYLGLCCL